MQLSHKHTFAGKQRHMQSIADWFVGLWFAAHSYCLLQDHHKSFKKK